MVNNEHYTTLTFPTEKVPAKQMHKGIPHYYTLFLIRRFRTTEDFIVGATHPTKSYLLAAVLLFQKLLE